MLIRSILSVVLFCPVVFSAEPAPGTPPHWSYQPLGVVVPPEVSGTSAVANPIDRFVLSRLAKLSI